MFAIAVAPVQEGVKPTVHVNCTHDCFGRQFVHSRAFVFAFEPSASVSIWVGEIHVPSCIMRCYRIRLSGQVAVMKSE